MRMGEGDSAIDVQNKNPLHITVAPSVVALQNVTHSYQQTWVRKLFSSDPERTHALHDINIELRGTSKANPSYTLLTGRSMSGKSTLLNIVGGRIVKPTSGCVCTGAVTNECIARKAVARSRDKLDDVDSITAPVDGQLSG